MKNYRKTQLEAYDNNPLTPALALAALNIFTAKDVLTCNNAETGYKLAKVYNQKNKKKRKHSELRALRRAARPPAATAAIKARK